MSNQTILIFIAAAAVVLLALFWRSKREERRVRAAQEKFQTNVEDPLTRSTRHEPEMSSMPDDDDEDEAPAKTPVEPVLPQEPTVGGVKPAAKSAAMPSEEPPIYDELEAEAEEQEREEECAADAAAAQWRLAKDGYRAEEIQKQEASVKALLAQLASAKSTEARLKALLAKGAADRQSYDDTQYAAERLAGEVAAAAAQLKQLKTGLRPDEIAAKATAMRQADAAVAVLEDRIERQSRLRAVS